MTTVKNTQSKFGGRKQTIVPCKSSVKKATRECEGFLQVEDTDLHFALKNHGAAICNVEFAAATSRSERLQERISTGPLRICFCLRRDENVLGQFLQKLSSQSSFKFRMILLDIQIGFARKVRNLRHIYGEVKSSLEVQNNNLSTPNKEIVAATKRILNTPQENSPCRKAVRINSPRMQANLHRANRCPLRDG